MPHLHTFRGERSFYQSNRPLLRSRFHFHFELQLQWARRDHRPSQPAAEEKKLIIVVVEQTNRLILRLVMFGKRLFHKAVPQPNTPQGRITLMDLNLRISLHYGIPSTASILAFDPIQRLLAIGTLDGRIKVIGGDNIECLFVSSKQLPYKSLEFLHNQGYLVSISNENDIEVWDLEHRCVTHYLQWESNITAFSLVYRAYFMYVGDEFGLISVLKYDAEEGKLLQLPYNIPAYAATGATNVSLSNQQSVVGILSQPCTSENRVLIAYENGLIILWDVHDEQVVVVRGYTDLNMKDEANVEHSSSVGTKHQSPTSEYDQEKEICSLCWVSSDGSVLAVGYIDGDILLWNFSSPSTIKGQQASISSNNVVKLQLSSEKRRIPVIVLHWCSSSKPYNDRGGQLFIYGGDEIGSEEVLTVLNLEWSSGLESLRCISRVDLTLNGSFADMILIPSAGAMKNIPTAALFVLTNPGQLHAYDGITLSALTSHQEKSPILVDSFPVLIPTVDPSMTVVKLCLLPKGGKSSLAFLKISTAVKTRVPPVLSSGTKWPLTGGVPSPMSFSDDIGIERIYIAGYQDGSIRIWDATHPVLSLLFVLEGEIPGIGVSSQSCSVSALDFSSVSESLAVGNESGMVSVYKLSGSSDEKTCCFVSEDKLEDRIIHCGRGLHCIAVFSIHKSPIRTLHYTNSGAQLAVGCEGGQVSILDLNSLSALYHSDCLCGSRSPVISMAVKQFAYTGSPINSPKLQISRGPKDSLEPAEFLFILTRDARIVIIDSVTGNMLSSRPIHPKRESTAVSMHLIDGGIALSEGTKEKHLEDGDQHESELTNGSSGSKQHEIEHQSSDETKSCSAERLSDSLLLLCSEDALRLYPLKSVIQGDNSYIHKVNLVKPSCWSATFRRKDDNAYGLILLYQTGVLEIRSLPDLEVVRESSLMSVLRWSFKANMARTMSSSDNGLITLVNGSELAFLSILASENDLRIPDSFPCLHDKILSAAANAAIDSSLQHMKKQSASPRILSGIIKGLKGGKVGNNVGLTESPKSSFLQQLESIFSRNHLADQSKTITDEQDVLYLDIDDIDIDEQLTVASTSSHTGKGTKRDESDREKLLHGATADLKPRLRTPEEIMARYRKAGDVTGAASHARDKLAQRQEKLQRISKRTEELQSGAESFASMADELVKTMEGQKWWKI